MHDEHLIKVKMEDALDALIDYRGKTPKKSSCGISTLSAKSVKNGFIDYSQCYFISEDEYKKFMVRGFPKKGDILLTTEAPLGLVAKLDRNDVAVAQRLLTLRGKKGLLDNDYLLYYLQSSAGQAALKARESGTTVTGIKQAEFRKIELLLPSIDNQKRIASILSSLDEKIKNDAQINHNLEAQAQAIFKSWFVDFEPFQNGKFIDSELGSIPEGWRAGTLKEMLDIRYGKDHKKLSAGTIPVYGSGGLMRLADKALYSGESVLIPRKGTLNNVMRVSGDFWTVDTMFYSVPKCKGAIKFAFHVLRNMDLASMNSGSAVPSMTTDILNSIDIVVPPESVLASFEETTSALWNLDEANLRESNRLASLRDALLPKLMSGEIDVSEVEV